MLKRIIIYVLEHVLKRNCNLMLYVSLSIKKHIMCALRINYTYNDKRKLVNNNRKNAKH